MKSFLLTCMAVCLLIAARAQDSDKIKELEQRISKLEARVATLEARPAGTPQTPQAKKMAKIAQEHAEEEHDKYKSEDIMKAEEMYQRGARMMTNNESKSILDSVVSLYPQLNRAGCAQLYRAQQESGSERERLLKDCINRFANCYYLDGTQVGPFAMYQLANYYRKTGREPEARKLYKTIVSEYAKAVGHDGELIVDKID